MPSAACFFAATVAAVCVVIAAGTQGTEASVKTAVDAACKDEGAVELKMAAYPECACPGTCTWSNQNGKCMPTVSVPQFCRPVSGKVFLKSGFALLLPSQWCDFECGQEIHASSRQVLFDCFSLGSFAGAPNKTWTKETQAEAKEELKIAVKESADKGDGVKQAIMSLRKELLKLPTPANEVNERLLKLLKESIAASEVLLKLLKESVDKGDYVQESVAHEKSIAANEVLLELLMQKPNKKIEFLQGLLEKEEEDV